MRARGFALALLLGLAACDSRGKSPASDARPIRIDDGGIPARIEALTEGQRDAVLLRAVRDAGHACQGVVGSAYNGIHFDMPSWAARCTDGADWLIMLRRDGSALVARREEQPGPGG